ncbi:MAG: hypothetical protein WDZ74_01405 [Candidatus Paceibacterota bacterium]
MSRLLHLKQKGASKKPRKKKKRDALVIRPRHDWAILFTIAVIANLLVVGVHAVIFFRITQGNLFTGEEATVAEVRTVNRSALSETLEYFSEKEELLIESITNPEVAPSVR